jgi:hypothetical protein
MQSKLLWKYSSVPEQMTNLKAVAWFWSKWEAYDGAKQTCKESHRHILYVRDYQVKLLRTLSIDYYQRTDLMYVESRDKHHVTAKAGLAACLFILCCVKEGRRLNLE